MILLIYSEYMEFSTGFVENTSELNEKSHKSHFFKKVKKLKK